MATIGNPTKYQSNPYYEATGNGVLVSFTLGWTPGTTASMVVSVGGVIQPPSSYTVVGNILTFTEAPPNGSVVLVNGLGVKAMTTLAEASVVGKNAPTGAALIPVGSTAQRPSANPAGAYAYIRYNNQYGQWEGSPDGTNWSELGWSDKVKLTGDQTIAGVKTFSSNPIVNRATTTGQAARYDEIGAMKGQRVVSASTTLSEASHGNTIIVNIVSGTTITMPPPNTVSVGTVFEIHGQAYTLLMNGNSTDFGSSFSVSAFEVFRLISDGGSFYRIVRSSSKAGVAPNKLAVTDHSYNVIYQAPVNTYLQIWLQGQFMNSARLNSGPTTALGDIIAKAGQDVNSNTWSQSITAIIPAGYYFRLEDDPDLISSSGWEVVSMRSYPLV